MNVVIIVNLEGKLLKFSLSALLVNINQFLISFARFLFDFLRYNIEKYRFHYIYSGSSYLEFFAIMFIVVIVESASHIQFLCHLF